MHFPVFIQKPGLARDYYYTIMAPSNRLAYLFNRYYEKNCTPAEQDELFELLQNAEYDETLKQLIDQSWAQDIPTYLQDPQVADKILRHIISQSVPMLPTRVTHHYRGWLKYAAAVIVLITIISLLITHRHLAHRAAQAPPPLAKAPAPAADTCFTLSDGSTVLLHKNAHIDYSSGFSGKTREVSLTGEAYFDIRHDERPFIVHTGNVKTTVLGTAFDVNADEKGLTITVLKGKVKVENGKGDFSILRRNEQLLVDLVNNKLKKTQVDAGEFISWKKSYLLFNDVSMREAIGELEQRFHVSVTLTNPASENCHVTAGFTQGEPLEQIIKVLSKINNMDYKANANGGYELSGEGCK